MKVKFKVTIQKHNTLAEGTVSEGLPKLLQAGETYECSGALLSELLSIGLDAEIIKETNENQIS